jgi:hypothetical protein
MSITSAAGDETKEIVELALHEREDEAVQRLTAIVERDERDLHKAAMDSVAGIASVESRYQQRLRKLSVFVGTLGGMAATFWVGGGYFYVVGVLPCLSTTMLITMTCTASGAGVGWFVGR